MKEVIQILPFGVVIWPSTQDDKNGFTNEEFYSKFAQIKEDLDKLINVKISIPDNTEEVKFNEFIDSNLYNFLKYQHSQVENEKLLTENIKIM